ncbi:hypothetical protein [Kitasatospora phosalacinea]|nr:hypothetical protein [Kitasatospora phosalacinea]
MLTTARPDCRPSRPARVWGWLRRNASAVSALAAVAGVLLPVVGHFLR